MDKYGSNVGANFDSTVEKGANDSHGVTFKNYYHFECYDKDGNLKWTDVVENLVVNEGLDDVLDVYFKSASATATWYLGLTDGTPTVAAADTIASHAGWVEQTGYTGNRQAITLGTVSSQSVDNVGNENAFAINSTQTIGGAFVCSVATGTAGTLYGAGAFSGGDKSVDNGDTLNVTVTLTASSS